MKITATIDGVKHWYTGGVSKQLTLFSTDENHAYDYSDNNVKTMLKHIIENSVDGKIYEGATNIKEEQ